MTPDERAQLRRLAEAATAGPLDGYRHLVIALLAENDALRAALEQAISLETVIARALADAGFTKNNVRDAVAKWRALLDGEGK